MSSNSNLPSVILTAVDGSEESLSAARFALTMAKNSGGRVVAIHVIHLPEYIPEDAKSKMSAELALRGETALRRVEEIASADGVPVSVKLVSTTGSVVDSICESGVSEGATLIALGTRGTGGVAKLVLGSVAVGVARTAKCSVLVVR